MSEEQDYYFSFDNFKRWMNKQDDFTPSKSTKSNKALGLAVESKVGLKKLAMVVETQDIEQENVIIDFKENGGIVAEVEGKKFTIEVDSGTFKIPRQYVRPISSS